MEDSIVHSDSRSLATLLLIRDIQVIIISASKKTMHMNTINLLDLNATPILVS